MGGGGAGCLTTTVLGGGGGGAGWWTTTVLRGRGCPTFTVQPKATIQSANAATARIPFMRESPYARPFSGTPPGRP